MSKNFFSTQYWGRLSITTKFTLAVVVLLALVALMALTSFLALTSVRRQTEAVLLTNPQSSQPALEMADIEDARRQINQTGQSATTVLLVTIAVTVILAFFIVLLLNKSITRNINRLTNAATQLQEEKKRSDNLLNVVIPIGVALSAEQNFDRLLEKILLEAKSFCHADAGTLYLRTENDNLNFVIVRNDSLNIAMGGTSGNSIDFPPVPLFNTTGKPNHSNVAAHVALTGDSINIPDAYRAEGFNFSGTKDFDQTTGYRSTSFLTIPLKNARNYVVGVLQLINALDQNTGQIVAFSQSLEQIAASLSSLATVALEAYIREQNLRQEIQQLRIEIDEVKRQRQVTEIVETDFFQDLQAKARNIRRRGRSSRLEESE